MATLVLPGVGLNPFPVIVMVRPPFWLLCVGVTLDTIASLTIKS